MTKTFEVVLQVTYHVEARSLEDALEGARRKASGMRVPTAKAVKDSLIEVRVPGGASLIHGSGHVERLAEYEATKVR